jgi:hypothetical protein
MTQFRLIGNATWIYELCYSVKKVAEDEHGRVNDILEDNLTFTNTVVGDWSSSKFEALNSYNIGFSKSGDKCLALAKKRRDFIETEFGSILVFRITGITVHYTEIEERE